MHADTEASSAPPGGDAPPNDAASDEARPGPAPGTIEVRITFPSDPLAVRSALGSVLHGLSYLAMPEDARGTLELVLAEALNNVVEHAHGGRGDGAIEMRVSHDAARAADTLSCELIDDGAPMPGGSPPPTSVEIALDAADLPEGGFGWFLIRELARDVDYARCGERNRLRFRLDMGADPAAG